MSAPQTYTARPRDPQWQNLSARHEEVANRLRSALEDFGQGVAVPPVSIVGPYGSGKSELMAWGFHYAWTQLELPALYITLETLLEHLPGRLGPSDLVNETQRFFEEQLTLLERGLEGSNTPQDVRLATDLRPDESLERYFQDLYDDPELDLQRVRAALARRSGLLFLDEVEQKYGELVDRVETSDQAPLREMLQRVEQGLVPFYLVMSFGLTSAYEAMSGADARRIETLTLPIPDADELGKLSGATESQNLIWWASRGRPGWAVKLTREWAQELPTITHLEDLVDLAPPPIDSMPLIDTNAIPGVFAYQGANTLMTHLIKAMSPVSVGEIQQHSSEQLDFQGILEQLPEYHFLVNSSEEGLLSVQQLADTFIQDLLRQVRDSETANVSWKQIRYYLLKIATAMADSQDRIAFGGWFDRTKYFTEALVGPFLTLLQDMILEFEGDHAGTTDVLGFLDQVMEDCTLVNDRVREPHQMRARFAGLWERFEEVTTCDSETVIGLSPRAVERLFPRMVGRPLTILHTTAKSTLSEQSVSLEARVAASGDFLESQERVDGVTVRLLFVPGPDTLGALTDSFFSRQHRRTYLNGDTIYVMLPLVETDDLQLDSSANSDIIVLQDLSKLSWQSLGEKRLQDFVISLWHNWITKAGSDSSQTDLFEIFDELLGNPGMSKANRRKLSYYRARLEQRVQDIARVASRGFKRELRAQFNPTDKGFPDARIRDTFDRVRINRAIEQVALAFDLHRYRAKTLDSVYKLRQLEQLKGATSRPNAYKDFLDNYTVGRRIGRDIEPAANLSDIAEYVNAHSGFTRLLALARRLGLDPGADWQVSQDGTDNAPLLMLYNDSPETQEIFIRGASLYSYLSDNEPWLLEELSNAEERASRLSEALDKLEEEVERLNTRLDDKVLSTADVDVLRDEMETFRGLLLEAGKLPPGVLHILYRFANSALEAVEEMQQRWSSEHGIQGWKNSFHSMLDWQTQIDELTQDLEQVYERHTSIKEDLLGTAEDNATGISRNLQRAARGVLDGIDEGNQLSDGQLPDADIARSYEEAHVAAQERLTEIADLGQDVDRILATLSRVRTDVDNLVSRLGE